MAAVADVLAHMSSEPNLAAAAAGAGGMHVQRGSVDSGYRSGAAPQVQGYHHQVQRSWEGVVSSSSGNSGEGRRVGRGVLVKAPPPAHHHHPAAAAAAAAAPVGLGLQRPTAPVPLILGRLPPCALPVALVSPGFRSDGAEDVVGPMRKGGKGGLKERMGLRKKISGLLWDRGGQREVGVEG